MKLIIDIPEDVYKKIVADKYAIYDKMFYSIKNGTPLPKGHGDLKDVNEIKALGNHRNMTCTFEDIDDASTVIEADKESAE